MNPQELKIDNVKKFPLRYQWRVTYEDGSELRQDLGTTHEHSIKDVDFKRATIYSLEDQNGLAQFGISLMNLTFYAKGEFFPSNFEKGDYELAFFRRTPINGEMVVQNGQIVRTQNNVEDEPVYFMGFRNRCENCKEGKKQMFMFVNPDDSFGFEENK